MLLKSFVCSHNHMTVGNTWSYLKHINMASHTVEDQGNEAFVCRSRLPPHV